jgi:hypothetical protein
MFLKSISNKNLSTYQLGHVQMQFAPRQEIRNETGRKNTCEELLQQNNNWNDQPVGALQCVWRELHDDGALPHLTGVLNSQLFESAASRMSALRFAFWT